MLEKHPASLPTLRTLAKLLGLSATAVSMALRNSPRISAATRERVKKVAKKQGYLPDPEVRKLMLHIRRRRVVRAQATLCGLTNWPGGVPNAYLDASMESARLRASAQGYNFDVVRLDQYASSPRALERVLRSRGVQGILLFTLANPAPLDHLLDWSLFSVVATSYSVLTPACHRVVPHHFENAMLAFRSLVTRGYRRIGLVISEASDLRTHHCLSAAMTWHQKYGQCEPVQPLISTASSSAVLRQWLEAEKPDVVVGDWPGDLLHTIRSLGFRVPDHLAVVSPSTAIHQEMTRIDERPGDIGTTAVDILAATILRGEKGLPAAAQVTMVEGRWLDGLTAPDRTTRRLPAKAKAGSAR